MYGYILYRCIDRKQLCAKCILLECFSSDLSKGSSIHVIQWFLLILLLPQTSLGMIYNFINRAKHQVSDLFIEKDSFPPASIYTIFKLSQAL